MFLNRPPTGVLTFGYVAPNVTPSGRLDMANFWIEVGLVAQFEIIVTELPSYEALTRALLAGELDLAWLPPIPLVALERRHGAVPLVAHHRDGNSYFHSVLVTHRATGFKTPEALVGRRAAWVDPYSASGYVLPRVELARLGVDVATAFPSERFYRSHTLACRAVVDRRADFAATWIGRDKDEVIVRAPWLDIVGGEAIRIVTTFGVIPSDTIAARTTLAIGEAEAIRRALIQTSHTHALLVRDLFGVDEFRPWTAAGYDVLQYCTARASEEGLLGGEEKVDRGSGRVG